MLAIALSAAILAQTSVRVLVTERPRDVGPVEIKLWQGTVSGCWEGKPWDAIKRVCADVDPVATTVEYWDGTEARRCAWSWGWPMAGRLPRQSVRKHSEYSHVCMQRSQARFGWTVTESVGILTATQSEADRLVSNGEGKILGGTTQ